MKVLILYRAVFIAWAIGLLWLIFSITVHATGPGDIVLEGVTPSNVSTGTDGALHVRFATSEQLPEAPLCDTSIFQVLGAQVVLQVKCNYAIGGITWTRNGEVEDTQLFPSNLGDSIYLVTWANAGENKIAVAGIMPTGSGVMVSR